MVGCCHGREVMIERWNVGGGLFSSAWLPLRGSLRFWKKDISLYSKITLYPFLEKKEIGHLEPATVHWGNYVFSENMKENEFCLASEIRINKGDCDGSSGWNLLNNLLISNNDNFGLFWLAEMWNEWWELLRMSGTHRKLPVVWGMSVFWYGWWFIVIQLHYYSPAVDDATNWYEMSGRRVWSESFKFHNMVYKMNLDNYGWL